MIAESHAVEENIEGVGRGGEGGSYCMPYDNQSWFVMFPRKRDTTLLFALEPLQITSDGVPGEIAIGSRLIALGLAKPNDLFLSKSACVNSGKSVVLHTEMNTPDMPSTIIDSFQTKKNTFTLSRKLIILLLARAKP